MAKQTRATSTRSSKDSKPRKRPATTATQPARPSAPPPPPPGPVRKPAYYEAIAIYERGVRALQRHDFAGAAEQFRTVVQRFPDERELLERARLYLRVCERETASRPSGPQTPAERIYAATVALNAGDSEAAVAYLRQALTDDPDSDHGHYIMSVALSERGQYQEAVESLRQAIALNPDNRSTARHDPDLAALRETEAGRDVLDAPIAAIRKRLKPRTGR